MEVNIADPLGKACFDFFNGVENCKIKVMSDLVDDDIIPVKYLFRTFDEMPKIEQLALSLCRGRVLDVGAGAGSHALCLQNKGFMIDAVDMSHGACNVMRLRGIKNVIHSDFFSYSDEKYDTILMLMNGIGFTGSTDRIPQFLNHCKQLLNKGGQVLLDSSDIAYLFNDVDTENITETLTHYYGEISYQMNYKEYQSERFKWLFIDFKLLNYLSQQHGWYCELVMEGNHYEYLARLTI